MIILQETKLSEFMQCAYLPEKKLRFAYTFLSELNEEEIDLYLSSGWRKFGIYYFKPACGDCSDCIPIRVVVDDFVPSKSQRRVLRKGSLIDVKFSNLNYKEEIYNIYKTHSEVKFNKETDMEDFISSFYNPSCPTIQSEYYLDGKLFAIGFIDVSSEALSSIYFAYYPDFEKYSPGTLSVLKEIEFAKTSGFKFYYLGYYVEKNKSMSYKNRFFPNEKYSWERGLWVLDIEEKEIDQQKEV
jgi:arginyl-tRNA--protein-N-Asp/Glu arginylyltransferase